MLNLLKRLTGIKSLYDMSGYNLILKIQALEKQLHDLGMRWGYDKRGQYGDTFGDTIAVFPRDDKLPACSRDAMLFCGSLLDLQHWIRGLQWARDYDTLIRVSDQTKREKAEEKEHERIASRQKHEEQDKMLAVLKSTDQANRQKKSK